MWVNKKKWVNRGVIESQSVSPCHQTLSEPFTRASVNFLGYNSCSRLLVQTSIQTPVLRLPKGRIRGGGKEGGGGGTLPTLSFRMCCLESLSYSERKNL